jgi:hypothetical protein
MSVADCLVTELAILLRLRPATVSVNRGRLLLNGMMAAPRCQPDLAKFNLLDLWFGTVYCSFFSIDSMDLCSSPTSMRSFVGPVAREVQQPHKERETRSR